MINFFGKKVKKEEFEIHKKSVQTALNSAKDDIMSVSKWVEHLNTTDEKLKEDISEVFDEMATIREELGEIKNMLTLLGNKQPLKQRQTLFAKQPAVYAVDNTVQTPVQTVFLENLSMSEKALVMIMLNTDMKLSYEDIGAMLGKDSTTVRGQVNSIKQKCEGLIEEQIEKNNKKRVYIPEEIRNALLKKVKVKKKRKNR